MLHRNSTTVSTPSSAGLGFLWLELTNLCNLKCVHCYAGSGPDQPRHGRMTRERYEMVISEAAELGCTNIQFIGGEPSLSEDLQGLIAFADGKGFRFIEVFTNLTHLSPLLLECFKTYGVHMATSVYSDEPKVHDAITASPGSFLRTVTNIKRVIAAKLPLRAGFIEMEQNRGMLQATQQFLASLGVQEVGQDQLREFGRGSGDCEKSKLGNLCGACGHDTLCIDPDGQVSPCIMSKSWPVGSVLETSLRDIVFSKGLSEIRTDIRETASQKMHAICDPKTCIPYDHCTPKWGGGQCYPCQPNGCTPCYPKGIYRTTETEQRL